MQSVPITTDVASSNLDQGEVYNRLAGLPVSSTNKTDRHDIPEILIKVALNTIKQTNVSKNVLTIYLGKTNNFFRSSIIKYQEVYIVYCIY